MSQCKSWHVLASVTCVAVPSCYHLPRSISFVIFFVYFHCILFNFCCVLCAFWIVFLFAGVFLCCSAFDFSGQPCVWLLLSKAFKKFTFTPLFWSNCVFKIWRQNFPTFIESSIKFMHDKTVNNVALVVEYFLIFLERACCAQKSCQWSSNFRNMRKLPSGRFISTTSSHLTSAKDPQLRTGSGCELTSLIGSKFTVFKNKIKKKKPGWAECSSHS